MIGMQEYKQRRRDLMRNLPKNGIAIIPGGREVLRNGDVHYPFRQNSDFLYLTGISEANAVLVLTAAVDILFSEAFDEQKTIWTGPVIGQAQAIDYYGLDESYEISVLENKLSALLDGVEAIFYPFLQSGGWEKKLFNAWKKSRAANKKGRYLASSFHDVVPLIAKMRLIKSDAEIAALQKAVDISVDAHLAVMHKIKNCDYEYQAAAIFHNYLQSHGVNDTAYPSIVAAGENACILHYTQNNHRIKANDLLLIDAGAEYLGYAADITRTYPVRGNWTLEQQAIYELVLEAQQSAINKIAPKVAWGELQSEMVVILTQGLKDLGILHGSLDSLLEQHAYKSFYMHGAGHWLGLDVHDVGNYVEDEKALLLTKNMVMTVEPGLYLSAKIPGLDARWHGIGVRIEDDIAVTSSGANILSARLPKKINELNIGG